MIDPDDEIVRCRHALDRARVLLSWCFGGVAAFGLLAGCGAELTVLTAEECRTASWYARGKDWGSSGHRDTAYQQDAQTCQQYGVQPDPVAWKAGWEVGFCSEEAGRAAGASGARWDNGCANLPPGENAFLRGYSNGLITRRENLRAGTRAPASNTFSVSAPRSPTLSKADTKMQVELARHVAGATAEVGLRPGAGPPAAPDGRMSPAARTLLTHLLPGDPEMERAAREIAASGEEPARRAAGLRLVSTAKDLASSAWRARTRSRLDDLAAKRGLTPTPEQYEAEIQRLRVEQLGAVIAAMAAIGGPQVGAACLDLAADESLPVPIRLSALGIAARHVDPADTAARAQGAALWERLAPRAPAP